MLAQTGEEEAPLAAQVAVGGIWEVVHALVLEDRAGELPELVDGFAECAITHSGGPGEVSAATA